jgi:threonine synthase
MWRYAAWLPASRPAEAVSLGEGLTPLVAARDADGGPLLLKDETRNPTGAAKDRAMSVAYTLARERGVRRTVLASTGSAGIAAAAYAARAGIACTVLLPEGTPPSRAALMTMRGARVVEVAGPFEAILPVLERAVARGWHHVTTFRRANPFQSEGPKVIAHEIWDQLGGMPDAVVVPVGGGGTLAAIGRGFQEVAATYGVDRIPRLLGVQHERYNALAIALDRGLSTLDEVAALGLDESIPVATPNLHHAVPPDAAEALVALRRSGGAVLTVSDAEALAGQARLAVEVGLLAEPSSAVVVPAVAKARRRGLLGPGEVCVAILTGSALRDPLPTALPPPVRVTPAEADALLH